MKRPWIILCLFFVSCTSNSFGYKTIIIEGDTDYKGDLQGYGITAYPNGAKWGRGELWGIRVAADNQILDALKHFNEADSFLEKHN